MDKETKVWVSSEHLLYFYFNIEIWLKNVYRWRFGEPPFLALAVKELNTQFPTFASN
jgi:hypothetical protein